MTASRNNGIRRLPNLAIGELNPLNDNAFGPRIDRDQTSFLSSIRFWTEELYTPSLFEGITTWVAVVLRLEPPSTLQHSRNATRSHLGDENSRLANIVSESRQVYKFHIPELHAAQVWPEEYGVHDPTNPSTKIIDLHPTCVAATADLPTVDPYDTIYVTFEDNVNHIGARYVGVHQRYGLGGPPTTPSPRNAFEECASTPPLSVIPPSGDTLVTSPPTRPTRGSDLREGLTGTEGTEDTDYG